MSDIIETVNQNPVAVLLDEKSYSEFYERVKAEVTGHNADVSTAKGRGEIKALAYKVTRSKTAIDDAGKKLNEEARAKINAVDAQRRKIREELDALADEVRRPVTEWEEAEEARKDAAKAIRDNVIGLGNSSPDENSDNIRDRLAELDAIILDADILRDELGDAIKDKQTALDYLNAHLARAEKAEADAAELARLRAEAEAREEADRIAKAQAEQDRLAKEAQEKAERDRLAALEQEKLDRERVAREAAENARIEAERAAKAERDRIEKEAADKIAAAEREAQRVKDAERARQAEADRLAAEQAARDRDRKHRGEVMKAAKEAMMAHGADEPVAKAIVLAIIAGEVPNVRLVF